MSSPKDFHIDAIYPEPLSRLRRTQGTPINDPSSPSAYRRSVKKQLHRGSSGRFRTQPITFYEIKEVDEENIAEPDSETTGSAGAICKSESDLKAKFELFYRSINATSESISSPKNTILPPSKLAISNIKDPFSTDTEPSTPTDTDIDIVSIPIMGNNNRPAPSPAASTPLAIPFNAKSRPSL